MYSKLATMYGCTPMSQALINQNDKNEKLMVDETICLAPNKTQMNTDTDCKSEHSDQGLSFRFYGYNSSIVQG